jgi:hypothetical protein
MCAEEAGSLNMFVLVQKSIDKKILQSAFLANFIVYEYRNHYQPGFLSEHNFSRMLL